MKTEDWIMWKNENQILRRLKQPSENAYELEVKLPFQSKILGRSLDEINYKFVLEHANFYNSEVDKSAKKKD